MVHYLKNTIMLVGFLYIREVTMCIYHFDTHVWLSLFYICFLFPWYSNMLLLSTCTSKYSLFFYRMLLTFVLLVGPARVFSFYHIRVYIRFVMCCMSVFFCLWLMFVWDTGISVTIVCKQLCNLGVEPCVNMYIC